MVDNSLTGGRPIDPALARVLKGEASPEDERAVRDWRQVSPDNEREYRELARLIEWSAHVRALDVAPPRPNAAEIIRMAEDRRRIVPLHARRVPRRRVALAAAAAAVVLVGGSLAVLLGRGPAAPAFGIRELVTSKSETGTLELVDGTVVRLAPSSRLRVLAVGGRREVTLEGRAFFAVAHRRETPFIIRTDAGDVTVLGTRLDVESRGRDLRLVVVQGRVSLASKTAGRTEVAAGEMGRILNGQSAPVVKVPDVEAVIRWTGTFLAFQSTPLRDAAREIERVYDVRVQIPDDALAQRLITAWFWDRSLREVTDVVCLAVAARCTIEDRVLRIVPDTGLSRGDARADTERESTAVNGRGHQ